MAAISSSLLPFKKRSVATGPGATALTVILRCPSSFARTRVETFDAGLRRDIGTIGRETLSQDTAGENDNAAAVDDVISRFAHDQIAAAKIGRDDFVEIVDVARPDRGELP